MAFNIAKMAVQLGVSAGGFASGLRSAKQAFKGFNKATTQGANQWASKMGASFASTIAKITILVLSLKRVMRVLLSEFKNLDEARKFAQSIGQAGEKATDKLLAFEFAAQRVGASSAVARTGLRNMSKAIGEAQFGFGEGMLALRMMGLDAQKLGTMLPTDAFLTIAKAMDKLENSTLKTAAAQKLFGKSGVRMLNLARMRGESIADLIKRHEKLAGVLSEADIAGVEATNDALLDLTTAYKGLQRAFMAEISPALFAWLETAAEVMVKFRKSIRESGTAINAYIIKSLKMIAPVVIGAWGFLEGIGTALWNGVLAANAFYDIVLEFFGLSPTDPFEKVGFTLQFIGDLLKQLPNLGEAGFNLLSSTALIAINAIELGFRKTVTDVLKGVKRMVDGFIILVDYSSIFLPGDQLDKFNRTAAKMRAQSEKLLGGAIDAQEKRKKNLVEEMTQAGADFNAAALKFEGIIKNTGENAAKKVFGSTRQWINMIESFLKKFFLILKGADKPFKENPRGDDSDGRRTKQQFGTFAEIGSQEASRIIAAAQSDPTNVQQQQLGALRTLVRLVQVGNQNSERQYEAFANDQYYTGGVLTR